jgi:hypothetical protein
LKPIFSSLSGFLPKKFALVQDEIGKSLSTPQMKSRGLMSTTASADLMQNNRHGQMRIGDLGTSQRRSQQQRCEGGDQGDEKDGKNLCFCQSHD